MRHLVSFCAGVLSCALLTGCGMGTAAPSDLTEHGAAIHGVSYGGQQGISGQKVYLMEAVTTGFYASGTTHYASKSLLTTGDGTDSIGTYVMTQANGSWSIGGDYTCDANAQVYLYALGGSNGTVGANTGIGLMAVLGQCPSSAPFNFAAADPFVWMNEVTTVAAAYAMAGYASDATHVSSNNTALGIQGMANAFANAGNLATVATGTANSTIPSNSSAVVPQQEINTLANTLAACVNSTTGSSSCSRLFSDAELNGTTGGQPTDTASAAINIAHNPGTVNIGDLYTLGAAQAPYQTALSMQPNDFTVGISFNGNGLDGPQTVTIDGSGNVWVAGGSGLSVFTATGGVVGNFDHNSLLGLAMDTGGNAWTAGYADTAISEITPSGGTGAGLSGTLSFPVSVTIDAGSNVWVANCDSDQCVSGGGISRLTSSGSSTISGGGLSSPSGIAIDTSGNAWVAGFASGVSEFDSSGGVITTSAITAGGISGAFAIAIDAGGNLWVTDFKTDALSAITSGGTAKGNSPFTGGGLNEPIGIAIDGAGNVWATNSGVSSLSEFSNAGLPLSPATTGLGNAFFTNTNDSDTSVAIDGSGNVWTVDTTNGLLIELLGAATPVVTPVVANLRSPYGASAVNIP